MAAAIIGIVSFQVVDRPEEDVLTPVDSATPDDSADTLPAAPPATPAPPTSEQPSTSNAPTDEPPASTTPPAANEPTVVAPPLMSPAAGECADDPALQDSATEVVLVLACRVVESDGTTAAIAGRFANPIEGSTTVADATSWFTSRTGTSGAVVELAGPAPVGGFDDVLAFNGSTNSGTSCLVLVGPDITGWKEICWVPQSPLTPGSRSSPTSSSSST